MSKVDAFAYICLHIFFHISKKQNQTTHRQGAKKRRRRQGRLALGEGKTLHSHKNTKNVGKSRLSTTGQQLGR